MFNRLAYMILAGALCLAAIVAIAILVSQESSDFAEDLGLTASALLIHGLAIAAGSRWSTAHGCDGLVGDEDFWRWVGVSAVVWLLGTAMVPTGRKLHVP